MNSTPQPSVKGNSFNKPAYFLFVITGIFFLIRKDFSNASIFWGLALIFDPFDVQKTFNKRPFYQKAWLIIHLIITFTLFALMFMKK